MNDQGQIVTSGAGYLLQPQVTVPPDAQQITISQDGQISVSIRGQAEPQLLGQLNVTDFVNPTGLQPIGQNLFVETASSGAPIQGIPGLQGLGMISQGTLETSNVNVTEELVNLIESQRLYEMNSKVISSVDQMLGQVIQQL
jgi:flagellar basal-body rod protein FlgG